MLKSFCFEIEVNTALERTFNWKGEGMTELLLLFCSVECNLLWDEHLWQKQHELIDLPFDYFLSHISTEQILFREEKMSRMFWSQMYGKHTKLAFTTSWRSSSAKLIGSKSRFTIACQCSSSELTEAKATNLWHQLCISALKSCQVECEGMKRN